jgi:hypothetical protein
MVVEPPWQGEGGRVTSRQHMLPAPQRCGASQHTRAGTGKQAPTRALCLPTPPLSYLVHAHRSLDTQVVSEEVPAQQARRKAGRATCRHTTKQVGVEGKRARQTSAAVTETVTVTVTTVAVAATTSAAAANAATSTARAAVKGGQAACPTQSRIGDRLPPHTAASDSTHCGIPHSERVGAASGVQRAAAIMPIKRHQVGSAVGVQPEPGVGTVLKNVTHLRPPRHATPRDATRRDATHTTPHHAATPYSH